MERELEQASHAEAGLVKFRSSAQSWDSGLSVLFPTSPYSAVAAEFSAFSMSGKSLLLP